MNERITAFLTERIDANDFPSAVYLVAEKGEIVFQDALGLAVVEPERIEARLDTIYDVASLTKPLVTGLLAAMAIEKGHFGLNTRVRDVEGEFFSRAVENLEIGHLAAHSSGLQSWYPFFPIYFLSNKKRAVLRLIVDLSREASVGRNVVYSDLNFILLGLCLEHFYGRAEGELYSNLFDEMIAVPLELADSQFNPPGELRSRIAASEKGNEFERQMAIEWGHLSPSEDVKIGESEDSGIRAGDAFRKGIVWGEVHDGNAYFMGGSAGHAGLFSTAEEVFRIALQFLPGHTRLLKPETCVLFRTKLAEGISDTAGIISHLHRSFAFELAATTDSTAGTKMPSESFGHNGFTGTSLWIDPINERIFILLTNRTHNHPLPFVNINSIRRKFHDLAIEELEARYNAEARA